MIRLATIEDIDDINILGEQYNNNFQKLFNVKEILANNDYKIFIYKKDNRIVGFLIILNTYEISNVILIFVDKTHRNQHIATNLLDYYISGLSLEIEKICLEVNVTNINAIKLYNNFGFEIIYTRKKYYSDNNDAYIMERKIKDE